jgi:predicted Fe-Mo cluster-binding NifX family protein
MKIAVVTDDHQTISAHFGRAAFYEIFTIVDGQISNRAAQQKTNHHHVTLDDPHHAGDHHQHDHHSMLQPILDCQVLITRGMGMGAYDALRQRRIEPIITEIKDIESAIQAYLDGNLMNHLERLH